MLQLRSSAPASAPGAPGAPGAPALVALAAVAVVVVVVGVYLILRLLLVMVHGTGCPGAPPRASQGLGQSPAGSRSRAPGAWGRQEGLLAAASSHFCKPIIITTTPLQVIATIADVVIIATIIDVAIISVINRSRKRGQREQEQILLQLLLLLPSALLRCPLSVSTAAHYRRRNSGHLACFSISLASTSASVASLGQMLARDPSRMGVQLQRTTPKARLIVHATRLRSPQSPCRNLQ